MMRDFLWAITALAFFALGGLDVILIWGMSQ